MRTLRVVVTGAKGQLGKELVSLLTKEGLEVIGLSREELNITDYTQVKKKLHELMPDVIIHAAAYTNVDLAEDEPDNAFLVNGIGTKNVAIVARKIKAKLVYVSTDYVFNDEHNEPIGEMETPHPLSVYGQSKLEGEKFIKKYLNEYFIIRTSWLYGEYGKNFVKTVFKLSEEKKQLKVVDDQIGCPTYSYDLAESIAKLIHSEKYGIYHISNTGSCSWYEFAKAIFKEVNHDVEIIPIKTKELPIRAPRPKYSVLEGTQLSRNGFSEMRDWKAALTDFLQGYLIKSKENTKRLPRLREPYKGG